MLKRLSAFSRLEPRSETSRPISQKNTSLLDRVARLFGRSLMPQPHKVRLLKSDLVRSGLTSPSQKNRCFGRFRRPPPWMSAFHTILLSRSDLCSAMTGMGELRAIPAPEVPVRSDPAANSAAIACRAPIPGVRRTVIEPLRFDPKRSSFGHGDIARPLRGSGFYAVEQRGDGPSRNLIFAIAGRDFPVGTYRALRSEDQRLRT